MLDYRSRSSMDRI